MRQELCFPPVWIGQRDSGRCSLGLGPGFGPGRTLQTPARYRAVATLMSPGARRCGLSLSSLMDGKGGSSAQVRGVRKLADCLRSPGSA